MKIHKNIGKIDWIVRFILLLVFVYLTLEVSIWFLILVIWEVFILITNPIGSHSIARAARLSRIAINKITAQDKYQDNYLNNKEEGSDQNVSNL